MTASVSPFSFVTYTSDNQSIVVAIPTDPARYYVLHEIDGVEADEIIRYAQEHSAHKDDKGVEDAWAQDLAAALPSIVAAIAEEKGINPATTYLVTKKAKALLSDINTCEVDEVELEATAETYTKAAETAQTRADHQEQQQHLKKKATAAAGVGAAEAAEGNDDDEYEDEYEDVEEEEMEVEDEEEESDERKAHMAARQKLEMFSTQIEAAIGLAHELGATFHQIERAFVAAQGPGGSLPASTAECQQLAKGNAVLEAFLRQVQHSMGAGEGEHEGEGGDAGGMHPGMDPKVAAAAGQQCPQQ